MNCTWVAGGLKEPLLATTVVISAPEINHSSWLAAQERFTSVGPTSHKDVVDVGAKVGEVTEGPYLTTAVIIVGVQIHVSVGAAAQVLVLGLVSAAGDANVVSTSASDAVGPDNPKLAATVVISAPQINLAFRVAAEVGAVRVDSSARADVNCALVAGGLNEPLLATTVVISTPEINRSSWLAAQERFTSVGPTLDKDVVDVGAKVGEGAEGP